MTQYAYRTYLTENLPPDVAARLDQIVDEIVADDNVFSDQGAYGYSNAAKFDVIKRQLSQDNVSILDTKIAYGAAVSTLIKSEGESNGGLQLAAYVADLRAQIFKRLRLECESSGADIKHVLSVFVAKETAWTMKMRSLLYTFGPHKMDGEDFMRLQ